MEKKETYRQHYISKSYLIFAFLIFSCSNHQDIKYQDNEYQNFLSKLYKYRSGIELDFFDRSAKIDTSTFNVDKYFGLFDKLRVDSSYKFDYYYFYFGDGGRPLLLAHKKEVKLTTILERFLVYDFPLPPPPPQKAESFDTTGKKKIVSNDFFSYADTVLTPLPHIIVQDSKMGYFQYLVFYLIGDQFALFQHSNYGYIRLVCSKEELDEIIKPADIGNNLSYEQVEQAKTINPIPIIEFKKDSCYVNIVVFGAWDGFMRTTYSISRRYPHVINLISTDTLVKYHCGVMF